MNSLSLSALKKAEDKKEIVIIITYMFPSKRKSSKGLMSGRFI